MHFVIVILVVLVFLLLFEAVIPGLIVIPVIALIRAGWEVNYQGLPPSGYWGAFWIVYFHWCDKYRNFMWGG